VKTYSKPTRRKLHGKSSTHYYVRERDTVTGNRRWINTGKTSLEAATTYRRTLELNDATAGPTKRDRTLGAALEDWLELKATKMTPRGLRVYEGYRDRWKAYLGADAVLRELAPQHVEDYFRRRASTGARVGKRKPRAVSPTTLNKERRCMRQFFRWAHGHGYVDEADPVRTVEPYAEEEREPRALSPEEQERLLVACREPYKAKVVALRNAGGIEGGKRTKDKREWEQTHTPPPWLEPLVRLAIWTGLRYGNLAALRWCDVDLEAAEIRISAKRMKKRRDFRLPIDARTVEFLEELRRDADEGRVVKLADTRPVLGLPDYRVVTRAFEKAVVRAKVAPCRFHDLRATFISDLGRAGVPIDVARELAGHRSIVTTAKHYRAIADEELRAAMEKRANGGTA